MPEFTEALDYDAIRKHPRIVLLYYPEQMSDHRWRMWVQLKDPNAKLLAWGSSCEDVEQQIQKQFEAALVSKERGAE